MEMHPSVYKSLDVLSKELGVIARYLSATKFLLQLPYCAEILHWQLSFSRVGAERVPDFHFLEEDWIPLLQSQQVAACLQHWTLEQDRLLELVRQLLSRCDCDVAPVCEPHARCMCGVQARGCPLMNVHVQLWGVPAAKAEDQSSTRSKAKV